MAFDDILKQIMAEADLPETAREGIRWSLKSDTREKMMRLPVEVSAKALKEAIEKVEKNESLETIDALVKKELDVF